MSHNKATYNPIYRFTEAIAQVHLIVHNLNDDEPFLVVYDSSLNQIVYPDLEVIDPNTVQLTFAVPTAIKGVVIGNP